MLRFIRPVTVAGVSIAALALAGCATLRVNSYVERAADFAQYRSYAWAERGAFPTGDPRLDNNRFFSQRVEDAVDMQLSARGFEKASHATADLLIHIHARMEQRIDAGTLLVDFMDRRTNRLAWRGWAERSFDGVIENQEWMEATIDETVARILAQLPRKAL
jgi:hypothetical protein